MYTAKDFHRTWASPGDWAAQRATITDLYQTQRMTLNKVQKIMEKEHQFFATEKMYKMRFDQWGLQKNLRSKQVAELLRQKTNRDSVGKSTSLYVRGNRISEKRLETYVQRTSSKNRNQINAAVSRISGASVAYQTASSMIMCRTPSPTPPIPSHVRFTASNSNPVFDYADVDSMFWFGMEPSPLPMTSSWLPNTGEPWQISQDFLSASDNNQIPPLMASWLGEFGTPDADRNMDWSGKQPSPLTTSSSWIPAAGKDLHATQECPVVWYNDQVTPTTASQLGALSTPQASKSVISCRRKSGPSISHLLPLTTPQALATPEECMYLLRNYVSGNFDSGLWRKDNFKTGRDQVVDWCNGNLAHIDMMYSKRKDQAFRLLGKSFDQYKHILGAENFELFPKIYDVVIELSIFLPDFAKTVLKFAADLSQIRHNSHHPFGMLMIKMYGMNIEEIQQFSMSLVEFYTDSLTARLGLTSDHMSYITLVRCSMFYRLAANQLLDIDVAEVHLKKAIRMLEQGVNFDQVVYLDIKKYLGNLFLRSGRYFEARALISETLEAADSLNLAQVVDDCYFNLFLIAQREENIEEVLSASSRWIAVCQACFGRSYHSTIQALSEREDYLRRVGLDEMADETLQDLNAAMEELCLEVE